MERRNSVIVLLALLLARIAGPAHAETEFFVTVGEQDFADGQQLFPIDYTMAQGNEDPALHGFIGIDGDSGVTWGQGWDFDGYGPELTDPILAASLTIGIWEHDSAEGNPVGGGLFDQVASLSFEGHDLTADLNAVFEAYGGTVGFFTSEYNVYTVDLPPSSFPDLEDGIATFKLTLQNGWGPSIFGPDNSAGLDFAELAITVPEPSALLVLVAGTCMLALIDRFR